MVEGNDGLPLDQSSDALAREAINAEVAMVPRPPDDPADDGVPHRAELQPARDIPQAAEAEGGGALPTKDEARDDIAAKWRQQRLDREAARAASDAEAAVAAEPAPAAGGPVDPNAMVELVINGNRVKMTVADALVRAQKVGAADDYLATARETLREAKSLRNGSQRDTTVDDEAGSQPGRREAAPSPTDTRTDRKARLKQIADKIQIGNEDEAADALDQLVQGVVAEQRGAIDSRLAERREEELVQDAFQKFTVAYSDLGDPELVPVIFNRVSIEMIDAMKAIGVPDDQLATIANSPQETLANYKRLRIEGAQHGAWKLPEPHTILAKVGNHVRQKFVRPNPAPGADARPGGAPSVAISQERAGRKDGVAPQPRTAARTPQSLQRPDTSQQSVMEKRSAAVRKTMASRGQPVV
jgi:hypothetical protein